jgi:hypothetical protein
MNCLNALFAEGHLGHQKEQQTEQQTVLQKLWRNSLLHLIAIKLVNWLGALEAK